MVKKLKEVCDLVGGELLGNGDIDIYGVSGIKEAQEGEITFIANSKYISQLDKTNASAIIVAKGTKCNGKPLILVDNPYWAFVKVVEAFSEVKARKTGIHSTAIIGENVEIAEDAWIQAYTFIGDNVKIGSGTTISPFVYIGDNVQIGSQTLIYPLVTIRESVRIGDRVIIHSGAVLGSDGFGFVTINGKHHKFPQLGTVVVEDDVEIGANVTVDRAAMDETRIGRGTKIDNLVQIAHSVVIGEDCLIVAQVGIAGSTEIKDRVTLAGQVGVVGHITIGEDAQIAAKSGVSKNIPPGRSTWSGIPAMPHSRDLRIQASVRKLPELIEQFHEMEKKIKELEKELEEHKNMVTARESMD